ncbi:MAG TPA: signal peptidase I [Clostridiales bacterium]|nr:signal peptidase I [Clostridiales bacterium]
MTDKIPNSFNNYEDIATDELITDIEANENLTDEKTPDNKQHLFKGFFEYVETFCYALVLMILLFMFVFRYVSVDGESMRDTLQDEDKLVISDLLYTPKTGDIVVIKFSPMPLIKRVIATGGQTVKIDYENWAVYIDGNPIPLPESYVRRTSGKMLFGEEDIEEFTVEEGKVYVMGDNRNNSLDSRDFGQFNEKDILGRVIFRVFPISEFGKVD